LIIFGSNIRSGLLILLKSTFNGKKSYTGCLGQSPAISAQFTLEMCVTARNQEVTKPHILGVQGHSKSWMLTLLRSSSLVLVTISSLSVPICNHFHARQANSGKIFSGGAPLLPLLS